ALVRMLALRDRSRVAVRGRGDARRTDVAAAFGLALDHGIGRVADGDVLGAHWFRSDATAAGAGIDPRLLDGHLGGAAGLLLDPRANLARGVRGCRPWSTGRTRDCRTSVACRWSGICLRLRNAVACRRSLGGDDRLRAQASLCALGACARAVADGAGCRAAIRGSTRS